MKKTKTTCHVCMFTMKTQGAQDPPTFCELCGTNMQNPMEEPRVLDTVLDTEAGGIKADLIYLILTDKRVLFTGDESKGGTSSWMGWLLGGIIGELIAGAIRGSKGNKTRLVSIKFEDITALNVEFGTKLLNKNTKFFTIYDKQGNSYAFQPGKKEAEQWEEAIRARMPQTTAELV